MKFRLAVVCFSFSQLALADFSEDFSKLRETGDRAAILKALEKAAVDEAENPEFYVQAANYWWGVAQEPVLRTEPPKDGDLSIRDKEGREVGSLAVDGKAQPEITQKAIGFLAEGAKRFPNRADIVLGLAHLQIESENFNDCYQTLTGLLRAAKIRPDELQWAKGEHLPEPAGKFIPESMQGYTHALFKAEKDELCGQLCDQVIAVFPDHPFAYNIKAALADAQGKPAEALKMLEAASGKAPEDPLILMNLGDTYLKQGSHSKAKSVFQKVLILDADEELKEQARAALKDMEKKKQTD